MRLKGVQRFGSFCRRQPLAATENYKQAAAGADDIAGLRPDEPGESLLAPAVVVEQRGAGEHHIVHPQDGTGAVPEPVEGAHARDL